MPIFAKSNCVICGVGMTSLERKKIASADKKDFICTYCFEKAGFQETPSDTTKVLSMTKLQIKSLIDSKSPSLKSTISHDEYEDEEDYEDEYYDEDNHDYSEYEEYDEEYEDDTEYDEEYEDGTEYDEEYEDGTEYDEEYEDYDENAEYEEEDTSNNATSSINIHNNHQAINQVRAAAKQQILNQQMLRQQQIRQHQMQKQLQQQQLEKQRMQQQIKQQQLEKQRMQQQMQQQQLQKQRMQQQMQQKMQMQKKMQQMQQQQLQKKALLEATDIKENIFVEEINSNEIVSETLVSKTIISEDAPVVIENVKLVDAGFDISRLDEFMLGNIEDLEKFINLIDELVFYIEKELNDLEEVDSIMASLDNLNVNFNTLIDEYTKKKEKATLDLIKRDLELKITSNLSLMELVNKTLSKLNHKSMKLGGKSKKRKVENELTEEADTLNVANAPFIGFFQKSFDVEIIDNYYLNKEHDIEKFVNILNTIDQYIQKDIESISEIDEIVYSLEKAEAYFIEEIENLKIKTKKTKNDILKQSIDAMLAANESLVELVKQYLSKLKEKMNLDGKAIIIETDEGYQVISENQSQEIVELLESNQDVLQSEQTSSHMPAETVNPLANIMNLNMEDPNNLEKVVHAIENVYKSMGLDSPTTPGADVDTEEAVEFKISVKKSVKNKEDVTKTEEVEISTTKNKKTTSKMKEKENLVSRLEEMIGVIKKGQ